MVHDYKDASLRLSPRLGVSAVNIISPASKDPI
jgi:hypothetical protein